MSNKVSGRRLSLRLYRDGSFHSKLKGGMKVRSRRAVRRAVRQVLKIKLQALKNNYGKLAEST